MDNQLKDSVIQAMEIMIGPEKKITYECNVVKCLDAIAGEYELNYMSNRITAYAIDTSKKYNFNDIVVVMAPQGDFNDVKYILGLANPEEALSEEEEQDNYINISGDLLDKDKETDLFGLKSYSNVNSVDITTKVCPDDNIFIQRIIKYLSQGYKDLRFSVNIKTILPNEQIWSNGYYGISLKIPFIGEGYKEYTLDTGSMLGNPKKYLNWVEQNLAIHIDNGLVYDVDLPPIIEIFKEDFIEDEEKVKDYDILFKNIGLYFISEAEPDDFYGYKVYLFASGGNYFFKEDSADSTKTIIASMKANAINVDISKDNMYWFEEDNTITEASPWYLEIAGAGWRCLNPSQVVTVVNDDGTETTTVSYAPRLDRIEVAAKDIKGEKKYKCSIEHKNIYFSNEITIVNESDNFDLRLESLTGNNIPDYLDNVELSLKFYYKGLTENIDNYEKLCYTWIKENEVGEKDLSFKKFLHIARLNEPVLIDDRQYCVTTVDFPVDILKEPSIIKCQLSIDGIVNGIQEFSTDELHHIGTAEVKVSTYEEKLDPSLENLKKSISKVLYDYNIKPLNIKQHLSSIAIISCRLSRRCTLQGHLLVNFVSSEYCNVIVRFLDNEMAELFAPMFFTAQPGRNSIGIPHSYLSRLSGYHSFIVTMQCTNGELNIPIRGVLFTIDGSYIEEQLDDVGIDAFDIAIKQLTPNEPDEVWLIGRDVNSITLRSRNYKVKENDVGWVPRKTEGLPEDALAAAIEFNGTWQKKVNSLSYTIVTNQYPLAAIIDFNNVLTTYQYNLDKLKYEVQKELDKDVVQVSLCRGYSSQEILTQDQGLICAYIKKNGTAWYVQFIYNSASGKSEWSLPEQLEDITGATHISVNRLNDYRIGILVDTDKTSKWYITERTYVGQAARDEEAYIKAKPIYSLSSMTKADMARTGTPIEFEYKTEGQKVFEIYYDAPLWAQEKIDKLVQVSTNLEGEHFYKIDLDGSTLRVTFDEKIIATREKNAEVTIKILPNIDRLILRTSNKGHGVPVIPETFTWTIERPITKINYTAPEEEVLITPSIISAKVIQKPLITTLIKPLEEVSLSSIIEYCKVEMKPVNNINVNISETASVSPSIIEISVSMSQTGEKPI